MADSRSIDRLLVGVILIAAIAAGGGLAFVAPARDTTHAEIIASPVPMAPFALSSPSGEFTQANLAEGWTLLFSGYTNCPDLCPTTLAQLANAARRSTEPVRIVFATMDPDRDDIATMAAYAAHFGDFVVPVTGTQAALTEFTSAAGFLRPTQTSPFHAGVVAHSPTVIVVAPGARIVARIREPTSDHVTATLDELRSPT